MLTTLLLTLVALVAFAANSLLARLALAAATIDAASFTTIRIASGAVALAILVVARGRGAALRGAPGSWTSAAALFAYAIAFSFAYLRLGAATGALILFGAVQVSMLTWGLLTRDRPRAAEIAGLLIAFAALAYLLLPGLHAPAPVGSALMVTAGCAWGVYSVRGRGVPNPLGDTAGNFIRAVLFCAPLLVLSFRAGRVTTEGVILAIASGAVTSGLGYAVWYRALPRLTTAQAATVQLTVPIIAAAGAIAFLGESLTLRLVLASAAIVGGVALAIFGK